MLNTLKDKRDAGFFTSIAGLMGASTVLDLDAFERNTKAEGLGVGPDGPAGEKNMYDADFTTLLFRFLQLTSEGHNNGEQDDKIKEVLFKFVHLPHKDRLACKSGSANPIHHI